MRSARAKAILLLLGGVLALGLVALAWAADSGSSEAQQGAMHNCPQPGKWAISVWDGDDGTEAEQALGTCGAGAVMAAYDLDPQTQAWSHWFLDRPEISTLSTLDNWQGVIALGGAEAPETPTPTPPPPPSPPPPPTPTPTPTPGGG